jgi:hypothetical protein
MGASERCAKEPIFSPYNERADCVLSKVIIDVNVAVLSVENEFFAILVEITQCRTEQAFGQGAVQGLIQPFAQGIDDRNAFFLSQLAMSFFAI